ncbi:MAG: DUF952 domain-containing protein [Alphaproteobacteria bacterium]
MSGPLIFKIMTPAEWTAFERAGRFDGAPIDKTDGFIHFSSPDQVEETAAKHFQDAGDLVLVAVDAAPLGDALKWEPSRGGALFPHLYGALTLSAVRWHTPLRSLAGGGHDFPDGWRTQTGPEGDR